MTVSLKSLHKTFPDGTEAVRGIDLDIEDGEFLTLLGPSGCGKTTTLRLIAGLEEPSQGSIAIGGRDVTWLDPGDRNVAMVFQSYALYPHMTALQNMTLNLTVAGLSKAEAEAKARETAKLLDIERLCCKLGEGAMRDQGASCSPYDSALARRSCSHAMASVRAHGPRPKARSTIRASPTMPPWRANIPAWPLRSARITSKPLIVA